MNSSGAICVDASPDIVQYLADIWPNIRNREASDDTWGDEVRPPAPVEMEEIT